MKAQEVIDYVFEIAPDPTWAYENLYEFGDGNVEIQGVSVAWWITSDILEDMIAEGCNLGLTHETSVYELPERFNWGKLPTQEEIAPNRKIKALATDNNIVIHRFHSNIDIVEWGMPHALLNQLGWSEYPCDWSRGVPVVDLPPCSLGELIAEIKTKLNLPFVRYDGDLSRTISRVAIPWGGLCQGWSGPLCPAPLGFDAIIGGDILDGVVRLAREYNWAVIDAMHHVTEMEALKVLAGKIEEKFPDLPVHYYENSMPWAVFV